MKNIADKVIAITGAGSGIGRELALQLGAKKAILALNDYNAESLAETVKLLNVESNRVSQHVFDVGDQAAVATYIDNIIKQHGQIDGIINNAGTSIGRIRVTDITYDEIDWLFKVNLWGVIYGTKEALPYLLKRPEAFVVNISSVFGLVGFPTQSAYCMSKFAVRGFTETLRLELQNKQNIHIAQVHPGGIKTNIVRNSNIRTEKEKEKGVKTFEKRAMTSPHKAAAIIIKGIEKKKNRILVGSDAKLVDLFARLFPSFHQKIIIKLLKSTNDF